MDQVLQSPEMLTRIIELIHIHETVYCLKSSLAAFARVNSFWKDISLPILWRAPPVSALATISRRRRQVYASHIRTLDFDGCDDPTLHTLYSGLQFPQLRRLELSDHSMRHETWDVAISQYFQPALEGFGFMLWDERLTTSLLTEIAVKCPGLTRVCFSEVGNFISSQEFLSFFMACDNLETIILDLDPLTSKLISGDLLLRFSRMRRLKTLVINDNLDQPEIFSTIRRLNNNPFETLTSIELQATSAVVSAAAYVLPNVSEFEIHLEEENGSFFKDLSAMKNLRRLIMTCWRETCFTREEILSLRNLHRLQELKFAMIDRDGTSIHAKDFTDSDFELLASGFPELEDLVLGLVINSCSVAILSSLSRHCPNLKRLQLDGCYDLQGLNNMPAPLFPKLVRLTIDDYEIHGIKRKLSPTHIARLIDAHAPLLKHLVIMNERDDVSEFRDAWNKLNQT